MVRRGVTRNVTRLAAGHDYNCALCAGNTADVVGNTLCLEPCATSNCPSSQRVRLSGPARLRNKLCHCCRLLTRNERCVGDGVGRHVWVAVRHCQQVLKIPLRFLQQQQQQQKCAVLRRRAWAQAVERGCPQNSGSPHAGAPMHAPAAARRQITDSRQEDESRCRRDTSGDNRSAATAAAAAAAAAAACAKCSRRGQQRNVCAGMTDFLAVKRTRHSPARARALISAE